MTQSTTKGVKQMCGMPFQNVDGTDIDIQTITCKNGTKNPVDGAFTAWWYDTDQEKYVNAIYVNFAIADDGNIDPVEGFNGTPYDDKFYWASDDDNLFILVPMGWKHDPSALPTIADHEKKFIAGEGVWFLSSSATPFVHFVNPFYVAE